MLRGTYEGEQIREDLRRGNFRYNRDDNAMENTANGDRYFHTNQGRIYREYPGEQIEIQNPVTRNYERVDDLWEDECLYLKHENAREGETSKRRRFRWVDTQELELLNLAQQKFEKVDGLKEGEQPDRQRKFGVPQLAPGLLEEQLAQRRAQYFSYYPSTCGEEPSRTDPRWPDWKRAKTAEEANFNTWHAEFDGGASAPHASGSGT
jgi:hypothetical protein